MLNRLSSQAVPREIKNRLDVFFEDLKAAGIAYVGHGVVSDDDHHTGYFSNQHWGNFYIQNQYFFVEPILEHYERTKVDLISWEEADSSPSSVDYSRRMCTQIVSGMTICQQEKEFNTFFNVGFDKNVDLVKFLFFKRDLLLAYFRIFNNDHLLWRKGRQE